MTPKAREVFSCRSILNDYNELMNNQSIKPLVLLGGLLLATAAPAKAHDTGTSWYSWTLGAGSSLCSAVEAGALHKRYAASYVHGVLEEAETDPDLIPFKQDFLNAYETLKKEHSGCKGLFK